MRIGLVTDIHDHVEALARAVGLFRERGVDLVVTLGDSCDAFTRHSRAAEVAELLRGAGAVGVWGNHDFGLCRDNPRPEDRRRYGERVLDFMGRLRPRLEVEGCLFTHVEPWLDPEKIEDLWYLDGPPETPEQVARIFTAVPNRVMFVGHYHCWLLVSPEGVQPWAGEQPIVLDPASRHLVVVHAVSSGKCALFDTGTSELIPFDVGRGG